MKRIRNKSSETQLPFCLELDRGFTVEPGAAVELDDVTAAILLHDSPDIWEELVPAVLDPHAVLAPDAAPKE